MSAEPWHLSYRADPAARDLADRHYNRQSVGATQFVPPGRCLVLLSGCARAFWVTSWPIYVQHAWPTAWMCSAFRSEGAGRASDLIRAAVAATRARFGRPPALGMVTFIDRAKVQPIMQRGSPTWGRTWKLAGFREDGETQGGLLALRLDPSDMPAPAPAAPMTTHGLPLFTTPDRKDAAHG
ncbi:hypothetical protein [uncultured Jannaschia sp.]|uniref:hypothetical protein n=1 Tax=uncultured Jannaschia sp. TaxID=293347 RepID=UPI0026321EFD|nr:hypothetical protein [uncultured Jannaschia sp.]